ncbi:MAG: arsenate reductase (glutaredoxin) [Gammaproteobacteria bacterium]|jgi:arsenate reductase (glutaredoxin)|nr:arsenate reductase (glutaredoxin) [Gammaproteobacteria bacterium]
MLTIYHNNRCSKSREVLALLEQLGKPFQVVHYLNDPLSEQALRQLLEQLQLSPRQLLRDKEAEYHELGLADPKLSDDFIIQAMLDQPKLMERPVVVLDDKAVIARPATRLLELF